MDSRDEILDFLPSRTTDEDDALAFDPETSSAELESEPNPSAELERIFERVISQYQPLPRLDEPALADGIDVEPSTNFLPASWFPVMNPGLARILARNNLSEPPMMQTARSASDGSRDALARSVYFVLYKALP